MIERPWMEAIERQYMAARIADAAPDPMAAKMLGRSLRAAETYAWATESATACRLAARSIPSETRLDQVVLPSTRPGFWYFPDGIPWATVWSDRVWALHWFVEPEVVNLCHLAVWSVLDPFRSTFYFIWPFGLSAPQMAEAVSQIQMPKAAKPLYRPDEIKFTIEVAQFFLAACAWIQQRIVAWTPGTIERHRRKQLRREYALAELPNDVKVVQLRRQESQPHTTEGATVNWSCRWIVDGHWTHQPYGPGNAQRRLQYVLPYVKGPEDKPLRVPSHTVYTVNR